MWTKLRNRDFPATKISTTAKTETLDTYDNAIEEFQNKHLTYMPMPNDGKYYNTRTEEGPFELKDDQYVDPDDHLLDVMEKLTTHPFLLIEREDRFEIINLSNLNQREVKDFLYPVFSELAEELSNRIKQYYDDSEDMFGMIDEFTLGTWFKARQDDVDLHIAEFLTLSNMKRIIKGHDPLKDLCGFNSDAEVGDLGGVEELRNKVMHGNRTLVDDQETLESHLDRIHRAENIVNRLA